MSTESKTPNLGDGEFIAPCSGCGVGIRTRDVMRAYDDEGNSEIVMSFDRCDDCEAELDRRAAERKVVEARSKAKYEAALAALLKGRPRQMDLDMGLD